MCVCVYIYIYIYIHTHTKPEGKRYWGDLGVDGWIRMELQDVGCGYMDWIGLAQDRDRWRTLVSAVNNIRVP